MAKQRFADVAIGQGKIPWTDILNKTYKKKILRTRFVVLTFFMLHCSRKPDERNVVTSEFMWDFGYPPHTRI